VFEFHDLSVAAGVAPYPVPLKAPPFRLRTLDGGTVSNDDLKGKVVLLNFWASWCAPCRVEFPALARLHAAFAGRGFTVVGIAVADTPEAITRFLGGEPAPFPILLDADRKVAGEYRAAGVPVSYLLDRQGRMIGGRSGLHAWDGAAARALVRYLLAHEES